jgi:hypothetical protein
VFCHCGLIRLIQTYAPFMNQINFRCHKSRLVKAVFYENHSSQGNTVCLGLSHSVNTVRVTLLIE